MSAAGIILRTEEQVRELQTKIQDHELEASRTTQHMATLRQDLMIAHAARSDAEARAAAAMTTISESDELTRDSLAQAEAAERRCAAAEGRAAAAEARAKTAEDRAQAEVAAREEAETRQAAWHRAAGDAAQLAEAAVAEVAAVRADASGSGRVDHVAIPGTTNDRRRPQVPSSRSCHEAAELLPACYFVCKCQCKIDMPYP